MNMKQATLKQLNDVKLAMNLVQTAQQAHHNFPHLKDNDLKFMMHPKNFTTGQTQSELLALYTAVGKANGNDLDGFFNQLLIKLQMVTTSARRTYNQALKGQNVTLGLDLTASKFVKKPKTTKKSSHRKAHAKEASAVQYDKNGYPVNPNPIVTREYVLDSMYELSPKTYHGTKYYRFSIRIQPADDKNAKLQYRTALVKASNKGRVDAFRHVHADFRKAGAKPLARVVEQLSRDNKFITLIRLNLVPEAELIQRYGFDAYNGQ